MSLSLSSVSSFHRQTLAVFIHTLSYTRVATEEVMNFNEPLINGASSLPFYHSISKCALLVPLNSCSVFESVRRRMASDDLCFKCVVKSSLKTIIAEGLH